MPIYEFKCSKCYLKFERSLKVTESENVICPTCSIKVDKLPPKNVSSSVKEGTKIPADIDKIVGKDAEEKWMDYKEKDTIKEKIRKESNSKRLSKIPTGDYVPLEITKDGQKLPENEAVELRKQMYDDFVAIKNDPQTEKIETKDES